MSGRPIAASGSDHADRLPAPALWRRMACFLYEGVLLFGVVAIAGLSYAVLTDQRHALQGRLGLQALLFVLIGAYFSWFWSHGGQTVAMKAWHIRLVRSDGAALSIRRALCRYLLAWMWFVPALLALWWADAADSGAVIAALGIGVGAYAALTALGPDRQFWHDAACGTRLVDSRHHRPGHNRRP